MAGETKEIATLAGGCFWCLEAVYDQVAGVESVESGYIGGQVDNPTYEQVCSGRTGHAEAVRITCDPSRIRYRDLLDIFFVIHLEQAGERRRDAISVGDFLSFSATEADGRGGHCGYHQGAAVSESGRHRGGAGGPMVRSRALPPGILRPESLPGLLHVRRRPEGGQIPQAVCLNAEGVTKPGEPMAYS